MTDTSSHWMDRARNLRLAFDGAFAEPAQSASTTEEDFLAIRIGAKDYALRLSEIAGLFVDKQITNVPSHVAALIGIAGFRGVIAPVYDLHLLLSLPRTEKPSWLVIAAAIPVALAFEVFDGHLRVSRDAIVTHGSDESSRKYARELVNTGGIIRPIVHLPTILDAIKNELPKHKT